MAYHKYQTNAFVLGSRDYGEAGKIFFLLTDMFGAIAATAAGVRKQSSKLRYALQTYGHVRIELVRGKEMWRIVGAAQRERYPSIMDSPLKRALYARMVSLVSKFVFGEGMHLKIFYEMEDALQFLASTDMNERDILYMEELWNMRFLKELGYLGEQKAFEHLIGSDGWDLKTLRSLEAVQKEVISEINTAFSAAQM